jgi:hypothetical protein
MALNLLYICHHGGIYLMWYKGLSRKSEIVWSQVLLQAWLNYKIFQDACFQQELCASGRVENGLDMGEVNP